MKNRLYILFTLLVTGSQIFAQCGARYKDMIFPNVTITSDVTYSTSNNATLKMDIYQPTGDTLSARPVLVMAHGGSFTSGDKTNDNTVVGFCTNFAKRGYVTVSIDYRLASSVFVMIDSAQATNEVMQAIGDGKSAIRFLRSLAIDGGNPYKIDINHIFGGGNSAGAVLFAHYIYIDSTGEATPGLQAVINSNGGIEGNSGNAGYSSRIDALVNLAGALNLPEFIGPGSKPSFNAQGDQDGTVPYECGYPLSGACPVRLCGLGGMEPQYQAQGIYHQSIIFPGDDHVPWQSDAAKFMKIDTNCANFLYTLLCSNATSVNEVANDNDIKVFPNPATDKLTVFFKEITDYSKVQLLDATGRLVEERNVTSTDVTFNKNNIATGMYMLKVIRKDASFSVKKVIFE